MADLRELLGSAASTPHELDLTRIRQLARRRQRRPRRVAALGSAALLVAAGTTLVLRDARNSHVRVGVDPGRPTGPTIGPTTSLAAPPTTMPVQPPGPSDPALTVPENVALCPAENLEYAPSSGGLLRFFNRSGAPCGLAGHPRLFGRSADGTWIAIPTRLTFLAPVSAPRWTGVFDPTKTAVILIRPVPPTNVGAARCAGPELPIHSFFGLRLELPDGAGIIELNDFDFDIGPCQPELSPFAYDSTDQ